MRVWMPQVWMPQVSVPQAASQGAAMARDSACSSSFSMTTDFQPRNRDQEITTLQTAPDAHQCPTAELLPTSPDQSLPILAFRSVPSLGCRQSGTGRPVARFQPPSVLLIPFIGVSSFLAIALSCCASESMPWVNAVLCPTLCGMTVCGRCAAGSGQDHGKTKASIGPSATRSKPVAGMWACWKCPFVPRRDHLREF